MALMEQGEQAVCSNSGGGGSGIHGSGVGVRMATSWLKRGMSPTLGEGLGSPGVALMESLGSAGCVQQFWVGGVSGIHGSGVGVRMATAWLKRGNIYHQILYHWDAHKLLDKGW